MTFAIVESQACHQCGRAVSVLEIRTFRLGNQADGVTCMNCQAIHAAAEAAMCQGLTVAVMDAPPEEMRCPMCKLTFGEVWAQTGVKNCFVQFVDGVRMWMCAPCSDRYDRLANQWRGTAYEHVRKLRGNK